MHGRDTHGIMASAASVAKIPYRDAADGISLTTTMVPEGLGRTPEDQINNLVGEKVKLMELKIENPPDFLTKHVFESEEKKIPQPRVALDTLLGSSTSTYAPRHEVQLSDEPVSAAVNPLKNFARMMNVDEILPRGAADTQNKTRRAEKTPAKTRAEILRDLPPLQY
jgi:hypothetical protein